MTEKELNERITSSLREEDGFKFVNTISNAIGCTSVIYNIKDETRISIIDNNMNSGVSVTIYKHFQNIEDAFKFIKTKTKK